MDKETIALIATLASLAVGLAALVGAWLWRKAQVSSEAHADRGAVAAGRDQTVSGAVVTGDRAGPVIVAQPGATVNVYYDGLPQAPPQVRDPFEEGERLQDAEQHEAAIAEFEKAFAAADNDSQRCALHTLIGNSFLHTSRLPEAEGRYREALGLARKAQNRDGEAAALMGLGLIYADKSQLAKAEEHYKRALAIHGEIGDRLGQANTLGNLGLVYRRRGELDKAEEHHKEALAIFEEIGNRLGQANDLGNLGLVYARQGELDKAEKHYKEALAIDEEIGNRLGQAAALANLGLVYARRGELDKAEQHSKKALAIEEEIGNRLGQAQNLGNLGVLAAERGQLDSARELLGQAQALYKETGAGGRGPETVREALEHLEATSPPAPKPKPPRKKP